ncbi:MAG: precorrin-4 C(11)-methyltransferase [Mycobacteriaceae bacterium]
MTVYFIGAGPGAADLITVRGQEIIKRSSVCLYAGSLVPTELLTLCPPTGKIVNTARMDLNEIIAVIAKAHQDGHDIARLHSGDPSIYSAVAEQVRHLSKLNIPYSIVPGVPSFAAAAAALGKELTVPGVAQSIILTRVSTLSTAMPEGEDLPSLAQAGTTMVIHLAAAQIDQVVKDLGTAYEPECPVAVVAFASQPGEVILRGKLSTISLLVKEHGISKTAVIIVGHALAAEEFEESYLYSAERSRGTH